MTKKGTIIEIFELQESFQIDDEILETRLCQELIVRDKENKVYIVNLSNPEDYAEKYGFLIEGDEIYFYPDISDVGEMTGSIADIAPFCPWKSKKYNINLSCRKNKNKDKKPDTIDPDYWILPADKN